MPIYRYHCTSDTCNETMTLMRTSGDRDNPVVCEKCGATTIRLLSEPLGAIVTEKPDKYRGKSVKVGINDALKQRSHEHFVNTQMDELIQKHGVKHARSVGWIDKTGKRRKLIDEK